MKRIGSTVLLAFSISFTAVASAQSPSNRDSDDVGSATPIIDAPLSINTKDLRSYCKTELTQRFGKVTGMTLMAVDGHSAAGPGLVYDQAAVICLADAAASVTPIEGLRVGLSFGAAGTRNFFYHAKGDFYAPKVPSLTVLLTEGTSPEQVNSLGERLTKQYPALRVETLAAVGVITMSAEVAGELGTDITADGARQLASAIRDVRQIAGIQEVELSGAAYPVPFAFSAMAPIPTTTIDFDLNAFRTATRELVKEGVLLVTVPAFCAPFGIGPIMAFEQNPAPIGI